MWAGALISGSWVLTSAKNIRDYTFFIVGVGSNSLRATSIQMNVTKAIVHPHFNKKDFRNNIALLKLPAALATTESVAPVRLPTSAQRYASFAGLEATISGFFSFKKGNC